MHLSHLGPASCIFHILNSSMFTVGSNWPNGPESSVTLPGYPQESGIHIWRVGITDDCDPCLLVWQEILHFSQHVKQSKYIKCKIFINIKTKYTIQCKLDKYSLFTTKTYESFFLLTKSNPLQLYSRSDKQIKGIRSDRESAWRTLYRRLYRGCT